MEHGDSIADLIIDFLKSHNWPMEFLTAEE